MELIKFLKENRGFLNVRNIERTCGIPQGLLSKVMDGKNLPRKHAVSLIDFFDRFSVSLETPATPESSEVVWDLASNHQPTVGGYRIVNSKGQKPVLRGGELMVIL